MQALQDLLSRCSDVEELAEGGQKRVLSAIHPDFGSVVIKYGQYGQLTSLERISREVELLNELDSPYYPKHHEFLIDPGSRGFLILEERIDGIELTRAKDRFSDPEKILRLLRSLVAALNEIWKRNVVHRDLKPANILITAEGDPRIIDLGIARFLGRTSLTASMAQQGPATPIYAAPEQLMNRKAMIGVRTDFFLLGIVILELMLGFHPFDPRHVGNEATLVQNLLDGHFVEPPEGTHPVLHSFVTRVLHPAPYRRFRTVDEMATHIGAEGIG